MSSVSVEGRIARDILEQPTDCYICLETLDGSSGRNDPGHVVVPTFINRNRSCGHMLHASCAKGIIQQGGKFDGGYLIYECSVCKFAATRFETALLLFGEFSTNYFPSD